MGSAGSQIVKALFIWLPLIAIVLHMLEEFVWPGGFAQWFRSYPPGNAAKVSTRFLVIVNVVFVALALVPPLLGATAKGYAYWALVTAIAGANGLFHIRATMRTRKYSPGVVTGTLLYIPLAIGGMIALKRQGLLATSSIIQALLFAVAYLVWSAWQHRRHSVKVALIATLLFVPTSGLQAQSASILGTWRGTSTCVDKVRHPGCNNEVAHYEVRAVPGSRDTVRVNAGRIASGERLLVSEDNFVRQPDGSWVADIRAPRFHLMVKLAVAGDRMTGELVDLADHSRVREITLKRVEK